MGFIAVNVRLMYAINVIRGRQVSQDRVADGMRQVNMVITANVAIVIALNPQTDRIRTALRPLIEYVDDISATKRAFMAYNFCVSFLVRMTCKEVRIMFLSQDNNKGVMFLAISHTFSNVLPIRIIVTDRTDNGRFSIVIGRLVADNVMSVAASEFAGRISHNVYNDVTYQRTNVTRRNVLLNRPNDFRPTIYVRAIMLKGASIVRALVRLRHGAQFVDISSTLNYGSSGAINDAIAMWYDQDDVFRSKRTFGVVEI